MTREEELENMLRMLLAMCDRLKADARDKEIAWDDRKPTIFYLQRNMELARDLLMHNVEFSGAQRSGASAVTQGYASGDEK